jgi:Ribosomal protein L11 methylase
MKIPAPRVDEILDAACLMDSPPGAWEDVETGDAWIEAFGADERELLAAATELEAIAAAAGIDTVALIAPLAKEDWTESWKKFFHVLHATKRVVIRPAWEEYAAAPGEIVIDIEPGMSFGTGLHATTRACIGFIERLALEAGADGNGGGNAGNAGNGDKQSRATCAALRLVDMGCGSGILAIAARKLGFAQVSGFDHDPLSIKISKENADANGLPGIPFSECDILCPPLPEADIFVANILAPVLEQAAPFVRAAIPAQTGRLVLSGILETQYDSVKTIYESLGFREIETAVEGEWKSGLFAG